jgi:hypothetical protein
MRLISGRRVVRGSSIYCRPLIDWWEVFRVCAVTKPSHCGSSARDKIPVQRAALFDISGGTLTQHLG